MWRGLLSLAAALLAGFAAAQEGSGSGSAGPGTPDDGNPITCVKEETGAGGFGIVKACGFRKIVDGPLLVEPPELTPFVDGVNTAVALSVEMGTLDATAFTFRTRLFCHEPINGTKTCGAVGPTLRLKPGESMTVTLSNALPAEGSAQDGKVMNDLRHPNHVNMHTHGLHIDPSVDNVFLSVAPGDAAHVYNYQIAADHMGGLSWYHSHGAQT